jgi:5-deoxy-glucuronate isomerase
LSQADWPYTIAGYATRLATTAFVEDIMSLQQIAKETCIIRNTAGRKGRTISVAPGKTAMRHLHYGRTILDAGDAPVAIETGELETGLVCLKGSAAVAAHGQSFTLGRFDSLYVPRDASIEITPGPGGCDVAEIAAPVGRAYPVQFVPFSRVQQDAGLHLNVGGAPNQREVNILIGKNVEAGRILAGVTFSAPGNWTSWPPHEHAAMLEEAYLYIDMPAPAFGLQLVYTNGTEEPELATVVREGDVVLMPQGYHPNVAAPGGSINFLWMMAANREQEDRKYGVVNVQPEFAAIPSPLDRGR